MVGYLIGKIKSGDYAKDSELKFFDPVGVFSNIGIAVFCFEGNGVVINLRAEAKQKKSYFLILKFAVLTVITWYMVLASICYFTFREFT